MSDTVLAFLTGAMAGQIVMIAGLWLWEWWDERVKQDPPVHPDSQAAFWDYDPDTQTYKQKAGS